MIFTNTELQKLLAESVAEVLRQGVALLADVDDAVYNGETAAFLPHLKIGGTVGGHFRHCLEFVNCFLAGLETGEIDYNRRARDLLIEINRRHAIEQFWRAIGALESLPRTAPGEVLLVKPEDLTESEGEDFWCRSSIERELEFMQSHTIHHYALIAFKLRAINFKVPADFGVAPSTLRFWKTRSATAR